jgi:hypothetical protein
MIYFLLSGCSWKAYDPDNSEEYEEYWTDEENIENSILHEILEESDN